MSSVVSYNCRSISPQTRAKLRNHHLDERVSNWSQANVYNPIVKLLMNQVVWCSVWTVVGSARLLAWRVYPCLSLSTPSTPTPPPSHKHRKPSIQVLSPQFVINGLLLGYCIERLMIQQHLSNGVWTIYLFWRSQSRFIIDNSIRQGKGCPISTQYLLR